MKKTSKHTNLGMVFGMCFGISIGTAIGASFDNIATGMCIGLGMGMALGIVIGSRKDQAVNRQIEEKGYTVKTIERIEDKNAYQIIVVSKAGEETVVNVPSGTMETELFEVGDVIFLDEDGDIEQAFDQEGE